MKDMVDRYVQYLLQEEKSPATCRQYEREIRQFVTFMDGRELSKMSMIAYKDYLRDHRKATGANAVLVAVNGFLSFIGREDLRVRLLRVQQQVFVPKEKEITKEDYRRLVGVARKKKNERLALLIETICSTGIRVSELRFITAEAVWKGEAVICMKGKTRVILMPARLRKALLGYAKANRIIHGPVFVTRSGKPLDRSNIWKMMKSLCREAGVQATKVFPHSLRHLFARTFYSLDKDISRLADILGHSSINTTRIYIISTGLEHRKLMDAMGLMV